MPLSLDFFGTIKGWLKSGKGKDRPFCPDGVDIFFHRLPRLVGDDVNQKFMRNEQIFGNNLAQPKFLGHQVRLISN